MIFTRHQNKIAGLLFFLFGIVAAYLSLFYRVGTLTDMGPGYFPLAIGIILAIFGILVGLSQEEAGPGIDIDVRSAILTGGSILLFAFIDSLGFVISSFGTSLLVLSAADGLAWPKRIVCAAIITLFATSTFALLLGLPVVLLPNFN